jgi:hypothetical protein
MRDNPGRIAQRESVPFTRERSKVRSLVRPPLAIYIQWLNGLDPSGCTPERLGHNRGTLARRGCQNRCATAAHPHPPPAIPTPNEETWLIHCDDIRVGSIVMRQSCASSSTASFGSQAPNRADAADAGRVSAGALVPREGIIRKHRHDEPLFALSMVA